ncbi:Hypothetical predicted protein [Podarcis lilfordi]|uniref:Uncharacterized protein n=1 Tax=Podarcis lilfordi TaxID=74358 RepID=A0AA35PQQ1_9SAUR|nr:Hypothetical predicted protein [Podarcis lilfordi]
MHVHFTLENIQTGRNKRRDHHILEKDISPGERIQGNWALKAVVMHGLLCWIEILKMLLQQTPRGTEATWESLSSWLAARALYQNTTNIPGLDKSIANSQHCKIAEQKKSAHP